MSETEPHLVQEEDCSVEAWDDPTRGRVRWRTLLSGDRTPTNGLTMGVAELEPGETRSGTAPAHLPDELQRHRHAQPEAYYVLSGQGVVSVGERRFEVKAGSTVFVPGDVEHGATNTGTGILRILYVFPADSFTDIVYRFSDESELP